MEEEDWITPKKALKTLKDKIPPIHAAYKKWCDDNPDEAKEQRLPSWYGYKSPSDMKRHIIKDWNSKNTVWDTHAQNHKLTNAQTTDSSDNSNNNTKLKKEKSHSLKAKRKTRNKISSNHKHNSNNYNDNNRDMGTDMFLSTNGVVGIPPAIVDAPPFMPPLLEAPEHDQDKFKAYHGNLNTLQTGMTNNEKKDCEIYLNDFKKALLSLVKTDDQQQPLVFKVFALSDDPLRVPDRFACILFGNFFRLDRDWNLTQYSKILKLLSSNMDNVNGFDPWIASENVLRLLNGNKNPINKKFNKMCSSRIIDRFISASKRRDTNSHHWFVNILNYIRQNKKDSMVGGLSALSWIKRDDESSFPHVEQELLSLKTDDALKMLPLFRYYSVRALRCIFHGICVPARLPHYLTAILSTAERGNLDGIGQLLLGHAQEFQAQMDALPQTLPQWDVETSRNFGNDIENALLSLHGAIYCLNCLLNVNFDKLCQNQDLFEWSMSFIIVLLTGISYAALLLDRAVVMLNDFKQLFINNSAVLLPFLRGICFFFSCFALFYS